MWRNDPDYQPEVNDQRNKRRLDTGLLGDSPIASKVPRTSENGSSDSSSFRPRETSSRKRQTSGDVIDLDTGKLKSFNLSMLWSNYS